MCSLDVTHVYEPKETIPIVFFKYGEQKPNINLNTFIKNFLAPCLNVVSRNLVLMAVA